MPDGCPTILLLDTVRFLELFCELLHLEGDDALVPVERQELHVWAATAQTGQRRCLGGRVWCQSHLEDIYFICQTQGEHRLVRERENGEGRTYVGSENNLLLSPERSQRDKEV